MFDAHCHLHFPAFDADRAQVLARARAAGIASLCSCAVGPEDWDAALDLASAAQRIAVGLGIHPLALQRWTASEDAACLARLDAKIAAARAQVAALGECGLDARLAEIAPLPRQLAVLEGQIEIARRHRLPLVLHCVRAQGELLDLLRHFPDARGLLHAFGGSLEQARALLRWDLAFSFGGALTLPSKKRCALVRGLPEDRILVETDAPDGPPIHPCAWPLPLASPRDVKRQRLDPAALKAVAAALAALRGQPAEFWEERSADNAKALFQPSAASPQKNPS